MTTSNAIAIESGHWYDKDGQPAYTVTAKAGHERATTLADAKKLILFPSVTTITKVADAPDLNRWKQEQLLMAALTLPRNEGEAEKDWKKRVYLDSQEHGKNRAEEGSRVHGNLEKSFTSREYEDKELVQAVIEACKTHLKDEWNDLRPERSFTNKALGYGGKVDLHGKAFVLDFKSKETIDDKVKGWDEQGMQLCAYRDGLKMPASTRLLNVFFGCKDHKVLIWEWEHKDHARLSKMFSALAEYWFASKNYDPRAK